MDITEQNAAAKLIEAGSTHFGDCESSCNVTGPSLTKLTCISLEISKSKSSSQENT
jgi:hypothetical protein